MINSHTLFNQETRFTFSAFVPEENRNLKFYFSPADYEIKVRQPDSERRTFAINQPRQNNFKSLFADLGNGLLNIIDDIAGIIFAFIASSQGFKEGKGCVNLAKIYAFSVVRDLQGCVGTIIAFVARDTGLNIYNDSIIQINCYNWCS